LGGEETIAETFHAIQEVGRQWPQQSSFYNTILANSFTAVLKTVPPPGPIW
jgi:hypothetical protein